MSQKIANLLMVSFNDNRSIIPKYIKNNLADYKVNLFVVTNKKNLSYDVKERRPYYDSIFGKNLKNETEIDVDVLMKMEYVKSEILEMYDRYRFFNNLTYFDNRIKLYNKQLLFWYNYLINNNISHIIIGNIPHLGFDYIIYNLAKFLKIPILLFYRIPVLPNKCVRFYVLEDLNKQLDETFLSIKKEPTSNLVDPDILAYLELRGEKKVKTFYGRADDLGGKITFKKIYNSISYRLNKKYKDFKNGKNFSSYLTILLNRSIRHIPKYNPYNSIMKKDNMNYIFMPLHFQPEASSAPLGGMFSDQVKILQCILKELPKNYKVILKPHKLIGGHRQFFERYVNDDRVIFVNSSSDSWRLMKKSKAVVTISGTIGWEAVLNSIPVLIFGSIFYQNAPGVYKIKSSKDLKIALNNINNHKKSTEKELITYLSYLSRSTNKGWVDNRYGKLTSLSNKENIESQSKAILNFIKKYE